MAYNDEYPTKLPNSAYTLDTSTTEAHGVAAPGQLMAGPGDTSTTNADPYQEAANASIGAKVPAGTGSPDAQGQTTGGPPASEQQLTANPFLPAVSQAASSYPAYPSNTTRDPQARNPFPDAPAGPGGTLGPEDWDNQSLSDTDRAYLVGIAYALDPNNPTVVAQYNAWKSRIGGNPATPIPVSNHPTTGEQSYTQKLENTTTTPQLPVGTQATYTPIQPKANEYMQGSPPLNPTGQAIQNPAQASTPQVGGAPQATAGQAVAGQASAVQAGSSATAVAPTNPGAATYQASRAGETPTVTAAQGTVSQGAQVQAAQGGLSAETNAALTDPAQGVVDPRSLVKNQYAELMDFEAGEVPDWARGANRQANAAMNARGLGMSTMAGTAITSALMQAALPIAVADAKVFETMNLKNLDNRQQMALQRAAALVQMDIVNLNNRQQAAVENARAFLSMDIANLNARQQTAVVNAQMRQQTLLSDQAADNAAKQFNAASENQLNQFFANLTAQISMDNARRQDTMSQFNAAEVNRMAGVNAQLSTQASITSATLATQASQTNATIAGDLAKAQLAAETQVQLANAQIRATIDTFNAELADARERFNTENGMIIEQSNITWNRAINTANTAGINAANSTNAENLLGLSNFAMAMLGQQWRDEASWVFTASENQANREFNLTMAALQRQTIFDQMDEQQEAAFYDQLGRFAINLVSGLPGNTP